MPLDVGQYSTDNRTRTRSAYISSLHAGSEVMDAYDAVRIADDLGHRVMGAAGLGGCVVDWGNGEDGIVLGVSIGT